MTRRVLATLLAGLLGVAVLTAADEPPADPAEPPVRLKKKRPAAEIPPPVEKDEPKAKPPEPRPMPEPKEKAGEPLVPAEPEMDEQEILNRVSRNMRAAEERLANKELGEPTRQVQRDILEDLDKLISKLNQPPSGGGGASSNAQSASQKQKGGQQANSGGRRSQQKKGQGGGQQQMTRQGGQGTPGQQGSSQQANNQPNAGNQPGAGGNSGPEEMRKASDIYKDIWGHLPEALRQEMTAYSREKYMSKYEDVIKQYYSTIAEKGRKKE